MVAQKRNDNREKTQKLIFATLLRVYMPYALILRILRADDQARLFMV